MYKIKLHPQLPSTGAAVTGAAVAGAAVTGAAVTGGAGGACPPPQPSLNILYFF